MKWKDEALERLARYPLMEKATKTIPLELQRLEAEALAMGRLDLNRAGSRSAKSREEWMLNNLAMRQHLQWSLEDAVSWLGVTNMAIKCLPQEDRWVLENMYIHKLVGIEEVESHFRVERSSAYRRREKALERFALALYGGLES